MHPEWGIQTNATPLKAIFTNVDFSTFTIRPCHVALVSILIRAGVCRPCDTIEPTAISCNFSLCRRVEKLCADRQLFRYSSSRS